MQLLRSSLHENMNCVVVLCALCCALTIGLAHKIPIESCDYKGKEYVSPYAVDFTPCPTLPCQIKSGQTVKVIFQFIAKTSATTAKVEIGGYPLGRIPLWDIYVTMPLNETASNGCNFMKCPVNKGDNVTFSMEVVADFPPLPQPADVILIIHFGKRPRKGLRVTSTAEKGLDVCNSAKMKINPRSHGIAADVEQGLN